MKMIRLFFRFDSNFSSISQMVKNDVTILTGYEKRTDHLVNINSGFVKFCQDISNCSGFIMKIICHV